jgi:hypothetical protein
MLQQNMSPTAQEMLAQQQHRQQQQHSVPHQPPQRMAMAPPADGSNSVQPPASGFYNTPAYQTHIDQLGMSRFHSVPSYMKKPHTHTPTTEQEYDAQADLDEALNNEAHSAGAGPGPFPPAFLREMGQALPQDNDPAQGAQFDFDAQLLDTDPFGLSASMQIPTGSGAFNYGAPPTGGR